MGATTRALVLQAWPLLQNYGADQQRRKSGGPKPAANFLP